MIGIGVDAGSRAIKIVIYDAARGEPVASGVADQGVEQERLARELLGRLRAEARLDGNGLDGNGREPIVATGYGRGLIGFADRAITEITCHARGVRQVVPEARTIVEIGGQDSKVIFLDENGTTQDFVMNDRCAAGAGCFLETAARRLGMDLTRLGELAAGSLAPAPISSMCVVFAETEIVGLLAAGATPADLAAGVQDAIARRVVAMLGRRLRPPVAFTGGLALAPGMGRALARRLGCEILMPPQPQLTGALGAALLAAGL
jgi:predicted CoA-substrate-specific enzyme activase